MDPWLLNRKTEAGFLDLLQVKLNIIGRCTKGLVITDNKMFTFSKE